MKGRKETLEEKKREEDDRERGTGALPDAQRSLRKTSDLSFYADVPWMEKIRRELSAQTSISFMEKRKKQRDKGFLERKRIGGALRPRHVDPPFFLLPFLL